MPYATYRSNKTIATATIRFIVTVAIVVYKGSKLVVYRMLTFYPRKTKNAATCSVATFREILKVVPPGIVILRICEALTKISPTTRTGVRDEADRARLSQD